MPRDNDKNNASSRGRRDRPPGGKGRSGAARGPDKKFAKRGAAGKTFAGRRDDRKRDDDAPRRHDQDAPRRFGKDAARPARFGRDDRPRGDRLDRKSGDRKFSPAAPDRGPRKDFGGRPDRGPDRGGAKPWQKRDASSPDHVGRNSRSRDGARKFDKPRYDKPRDDRGGEARPRFSHPREDRPGGDRPFREPRKFDRPRQDRLKFDRPRQRPEGGAAWQEHPRSDRHADRPRRDNEEDGRIFAKRPAFGGRGAYRGRVSDERRPPRPPREKKSGERIAKVVSRAGLASRRDAEEWIVQGRVTVNGRVINSPALDVTANDVVTVDGKPLPPRERTRLFLYHKPRGLMTTHADPEGRPTVFDNLPEGLPRLISVGRLDFNTEGLLLLTNDGGLARALELPDTGWLRRYRVRAHGEVTQGQLDELRKGVEVDGVKYGPIDATLERDQGANVWLVFAIREGKNREVRNVLAHLGLEVNRLIRVSYGPFQLLELAEGVVEEVKTRVLREQLGEKIAEMAGADFNRPMHGQADAKTEDDTPEVAHGKKPFKPAGKSGLIADRKGRRVLVQRTGSEEARARNEAEAGGYGPPRRPQRGYHGKRDLKPRDE